MKQSGLPLAWNVFEEGPAGHISSDEDIRKDYPETTLVHVEASLSIDETDIDCELVVVT